MKVSSTLVPIPIGFKNFVWKRLSRSCPSIAGKFRGKCVAGPLYDVHAHLSFQSRLWKLHFVHWRCAFSASFCCAGNLTSLKVINKIRHLILKNSYVIFSRNLPPLPFFLHLWWKSEERCLNSRQMSRITISKQELLPDWKTKKKHAL